MALRIAILGASGAVGDMLAAELLHENLLDAVDRLFLVGHGIDSNEDGLSRSRMFSSTRLITRGFTSTSLPTYRVRGHDARAPKPLLHPGNDHVSG
jgi:hypothetical protein